MLNFNHLRLFDATARAGSVSGGAAALRLSQPALSKQIRELEAAVGTALLERLPRGVRTTPAGELLAGYTRQIFALGEEAERALEELQGLRRGRLRLSASMTIGVYLAPRMLAECRRRWPGVAIEFSIENTDAIQNRLVERSLDVGLTEGPGPWEAELEEQLLGWDELIAVTGGGALAGRRLTLAQLAQLPWVMREAGSGTRAVVDGLLAQRGHAVRPAWTFNNPEAVKRAVIAGCGIAVVPRITVETELSLGLLRQISVRGLGGREMRRRLRAQWLRGRPHSAAMAAFLRYCGDYRGGGPK